jgi:DNA-binding winged helix-turn-helix (wHTH) protein
VPGSFLFNGFLLDTSNRRLMRGGAPVELNARYLDALALMVNESGQLISKERFLQEVWQGVPVTDEALTQCIRTLRKQLGDDAGSPRFIETVPKHGYRFIAPVTRAEPGATPSSEPVRAALPSRDWRRFFLIGGAGTIGGGIAGMFGGLFYSFAGATQSLEPGMGAASVLLVLVCLAILIGLLGGAGVAFGIAAAGFAKTRQALWSIVGAAAGGLVVGAVVKLIGLDAFNLLFGQSPGAMTGGPEGALLGGAVGLGAYLANRDGSLGRSIAVGGAAGAAAGIVITLLGGRLMAGSLDSLSGRFPNSRVQLDQIGALFGENGFGPISQAVTGGLEGLLFAGCVVGAMTLARRRLRAV